MAAPPQLPHWFFLLLHPSNSRGRARHPHAIVVAAHQILMQCISLEACVMYVVDPARHEGQFHLMNTLPALRSLQKPLNSRPSARSASWRSKHSASTPGVRRPGDEMAANSALRLPCPRPAHLGLHGIDLPGLRPGFHGPHTGPPDAQPAILRVWV